MKQHLLVAAFAAFSLSVGAQDMQRISQVTDVTEFTIISDAYTIDTRNVTVGDMYYYRPHGLFYSGWNRDLRNPMIALAPINTELTFVADYQSGTPAWEYTGADGKVVTADGASVTLSLPQGTYPAPRLYDSDRPEDVYFPTEQMEVGGYTRTQKTDGKIMDVCAVNYVPEGKVYTVSNLMCTRHPAADKNLADALKIDNIHVRGFGEVFSSPAKMIVGGFGILLSGEEAIMNNPEKIDFRILEFDGSAYKVLKGNDELKVTVSAIDGLQNMYHVQCDIKDGNITVMPGTKIIPMVSTEEIKMTPMYDGQSRYNKNDDNCITMYLDTDIDGAQEYIQLSGVAVNDGTGNPRFINSWCISLDMSYAESDPSGIDDITADVNRNGAVYNVMGVKVADSLSDNIPSGIYVVNGRKIVM